jgi:hypothetical protein
MMLHKSFFLVVIVVLLLAGCQPVSVEDAQAAFCSSLQEFGAALESVRALTTDSTVEEAQAAVEQVDEAWNDVLSAAYTLRSVEVDQLDEAMEDLDDAIRHIDPTDTITEAAESLQTQAQTVKTAYDELNAAQCGPTAQ